MPRFTEPPIRHAHQARRAAIIPEQVDDPLSKDHMSISSSDTDDYSPDSEAKSDDYAPGIVSSATLGGDGDAAIVSSVATASHYPPTTSGGLGFGKTSRGKTPRFALARILSLATATAKSAFTTLAVGATPTRIFFTCYPRSRINNQGHASASSPGAGPGASFYRCATQPPATGAARLRIGYDGHIPRWQKGSTIKYIICRKSFSDPDLAILTAAQAVEATHMWQGIGVTFKLVHSDRKATFQIQYRDLPRHLPRDYASNIFAEAFFPQEGRGTLFVYKLALEEENRSYLANILAHEFGHILGLRHEFAREAMEIKSVVLGKRNEKSVMNYFEKPSLWSVQKQDLKDLKGFYDCDKKAYKGLAIRDFKPPTFLFSPATRQ